MVPVQFWFLVFDLLQVETVGDFTVTVQVNLYILYISFRFSYLLICLFSICRISCFLLGSNITSSLAAWISPLVRPGWNRQNNSILLLKSTARLVYVVDNSFLGLYLAHIATITHRYVIRVLKKVVKNLKKCSFVVRYLAYVCGVFWGRLQCCAF